MELKTEEEKTQKRTDVRLTILPTTPRHVRRRSQGRVGEVTKGLFHVKPGTVSRSLPAL